MESTWDGLTDICAEQLELPVCNSTTAGGCHRCHSLLVEVSINLSVLLQRKAGSPKISVSGFGHLKHPYQLVAEAESWGLWVF